VQAPHVYRKKETGVLKHLHTEPTIPERTVLIGASGFVGNAVLMRLEALGAPVLPIRRSDVDLTGPNAAASLAGLLWPGDTVIAAAAAAPCKTPAMMRDNVSIALAIVQAVEAVCVSHVINVSSDAVYADAVEPIDEDTTKAPLSLRGAMHLVRELMFDAGVKAPLVHVRPTLIYGATDPHGGYGPNLFRRTSNEAGRISLFGDGEERRDHVLVDDVAELVARLALRRSVGALNAATGIVHSFRQVADAIAELVPRDVSISSLPRTGPMPHNGYRAFDPRATLQAFPDFRYTPLSNGLKRAQAGEFGHAAN
jgi:UDP-glucose 4-epimerase